MRVSFMCSENHPFLQLRNRRDSFVSKISSWLTKPYVLLRFVSSPTKQVQNDVTRMVIKTPNLIVRNLEMIFDSQHTSCQFRQS
jgi:hypothetical protein